MFSGTLFVLTGASAGKAMWNFGRSQFVAKQLNNTFTHGKPSITNAPSIIKHEVGGSETLFHLSVSEIGRGQHDPTAFRFPIDKKSNRTNKRKVDVIINNIREIEFEKPVPVFSENYGYTINDFSYKKTVEFVKDKHSIDLSDNFFETSNLRVAVGEPLRTIYLYGKMAADGKIRATHVSDNAGVLVLTLAARPFGRWVVLAILFGFAGAIVYTEDARDNERRYGKH